MSGRGSSSTEAATKRRSSLVRHIFWPLTPQKGRILRRKKAFCVAQGILCDRKTRHLDKRKYGAACPLPSRPWPRTGTGQVGWKPIPIQDLPRGAAWGR